MSAALLAWPGIALTITFVDDAVAGPILAATGAWVGGPEGIVLGAATFTALVALLVTSALVASRSINPGVQARIDSAVTKASQRRFVGTYVSRIGDSHPWATAVVAVLVSPVLAVLLARLVHPTDRLVRTTSVAVVSYGVAFALFYTGLGATLIAAL